MIDFVLSDALEDLQSTESLVIANEVDASSASANEIASRLNATIDSITHSASSITEEDTFDTIRSLLKHSTHLQGATLNKLLDCLCSGLKAEVDATHEDLHPTDHTEYRSHKTALEAYVYLVRWFVSIAEKGGADNADAPRPASPKRKGKTAASKARAPAKKKAPTKERTDEWSWSHAIPDTLGALGRILSRVRTERIWQTTSERDTFISCIIASANQVAESDVYMKVVEVRQQVYKIFCLAAKNHGQAFGVQTSITQNLQYFEHLSEPMAELVSILAKEFDYAQCGDEILRTIANKSFIDKGDSKAESKDAKSFARFMVKLTELSPRLVLKQISLLQRQLDSESYQIRNAIVEVIGILIKDLLNESPVEDDSQGLGANGVGEEQDRQRTQAKQIQAFFDLLFERFLDLNSHVRAKTVTTLIKLMDLKAKFPVTRLRLTRLAIRSLSDKASPVRKNCIILLVKLIETHPYGTMHGGDLNAEEWQTRFNKFTAELEPLEKALKAAADRAFGDTDEAEPNQTQGQGGPEESENAQNSEETAENDADADQEYDQHSKSDDILNSLGHDDLLSRIDHGKLAQMQLIKRYYVDARTFIRLLESGARDGEGEDDADDDLRTRGAVDKITELLNSTTKSEVLEAMNFLTTAKRYNIAAADRGVKAMLHLVWAKESSTMEDGAVVRGVRDRLVECYRQLYFEALADLSPTQNVDRISNNLIELTHGATLAELTSLEELLSILMKSKEPVHPDVINRLWAAYSTDRNIPKAQRRGAIMILGMLAVQDPVIISEHLDALLSTGLGPFGKRDLLLAKYSCLALRRIGGSHKKVKGSLADDNVRLPMDNPIFERLRDLLQVNTTSKEWFGMAEQAINTIYILGDQPDQLCSEILSSMTTKAFSSENIVVPTPAPDEVILLQDEDRSEPTPDSDNTQVKAEEASDHTQQPHEEANAAAGQIHVNAFQIAQMIFIAGHYAIKQLIHLELVEREYKRRKGEQQQQQKTAAAASNRNGAGSHPGKQASTTDELDQVAGSVEDDIADMIADARERELLYGPDSLLSIFGPMTVQICQFPRIYNNKTLRMAAVLSLCKFMCVSARFCEDHLMFLFKIFETTSEPVIKSNIAIAMGDIAIAFSTIMDDNSDRLYAGLSSTDLNVKKNTLMVLTHLILNGMIKVKGQLGEMAKRLEDEERRVKDLAKLFFKELSQKENAIYNHLPDIVSSLSAGSSPVNEETFEAIMQQIFKYIDKEKQAEAIVEKLCQRFKFAGEVNENDSAQDRLDAEKRRWRDIALCLSMLPYKSERSLKKIVDGLPLYQDKLFEPTVFKRFQEILSKVRAANNKSKEDALGGLLQEFERALEEHRERGEENAALEKKVEKKKQRQARKKRVTSRRAEDDEEESE